MFYRKDKGLLVEITAVAVSYLLFAYLGAINKAIDFLIFCIYVMGFDLLYGHMGRISFGHPLYYGAGAYGAAMFAKFVYADPFLAIVVGTLTGAFIGFALGPIIVKTKGAAFALINVAFNQLAYFIVLVALAKYTGGEDGSSIGFHSYGFVNFSNPNFLLFFCISSVLTVYCLLNRMYKSPFGYMLLGIKENELRVQFLGFNTLRYKWVAFVVSTSISAFAGSLAAINYQFVNPSFIDPARNVEVIFAALIGGAGTMLGPVVGGTVYMVISNYLAKYIQRWEMFVGITLLLIALRFTKGIVGYGQELWEGRLGLKGVREGK